jgi:pyruvate dehydrogenase E1 component alpha subunit
MNETDINLFGTAYFIRAFEYEIARQFDLGAVPGLVHLCTGAEVAEVALASCLKASCDFMTGSHRSHGLALAMGAEPDEVAKEILGRVGGLSDGLAGTQHLIAPEVGFLTSNGIVGAQVPLAAGAALTAKTQDSGGVGVAVFGDGAANQGAVLETMNLAVTLSLPMVFVLENNGFGQSTSSEYAAGCESFTARAAAFGLEVYTADSHQAQSCFQAMAAAVEAARTGVPTFVEASVVRLSGHYHTEDEAYRLGAQGNDPLANWCMWLCEQGISQQQLEKTKAKQVQRAEQIVKNAALEPIADSKQLTPWITELGVHDD